MSRWYVLLMAIIPAIAPATIRSTGFRVPSPVSRFRSLESILHSEAHHNCLIMQVARNKGGPADVPCGTTAITYDECTTH